MRTVALLLALLLCAGVLASGCGGGSDAAPAQFGEQPFDNDPGDGNPDPDPQPLGNTTNNAIVPTNLAPPVGVTFHVGVTENVTLPEMQTLFATFVAANNALWKISEGQVRIHRVRFRDNAAPGVMASTFFFNNGSVNTATLDVVAFPQLTWNINAGGAVDVVGGRQSRTMMVPTNINTFVLLHELSHFLFQLNWSVGPVLGDEYQDGIQDPGCVMESENTPWRWCAEHNHTNQNSQPHSCWRQILSDYPFLAHAGTDDAPDLPPAPIAEYDNVP